jgi:Mg2+ and Co2+ transporter CorA
MDDMEDDEKNARHVLIQICEHIAEEYGENARIEELENRIEELEGEVEHERENSENRINRIDELEECLRDVLTIRDMMNDVESTLNYKG